MRILVDMQGAQSASRFRGIGNYSRSLVRAMGKLNTDHEIILCVNGMLREGADDIRRQLGPTFGQMNIVEWQALPSIAGWNPGHTSRRITSEIIRERFLQSMSADRLLVTSHFEGFVDDAATSIGHTNSSLPCSVIAYDLIPALNRNTYLRDSVYRSFYEAKLKQFAKADQFLCISESTKDELLSVFQPEEKKLRVIYAGVSSAFENRGHPRSAKRKLHKLGDYVLYPGGMDDRKNLSILINAMGRLPASIQRQYKLAILGRIESAEQEKVFQWANAANFPTNQIVMTGFVSEVELVGLYDNAALVVFPSLHEGFGLPLLEAMACETSVIAADAPGIREIAVGSPGLFDPTDASGLALLIERAISDKDFCDELVTFGRKTLERFSWARTAQLTMDAMISPRHLELISQTLGKRPTLAYISPLPPERTGIADYSAELLPALAEHYDIVCVVDETTVSHNIKAGGLKTISTQEFSKAAHDFDRILYHFGNSPFHTHMFGLLRQFPGVVVLHDQFFGSFLNFAERYLGWEMGFWRALYRSHGWTPLIERCSKSDDTVINSWPASREIIYRALGVITHSKAAQQIAQTFYNELNERRWRTVRFPRAQPDCVSTVSPKRPTKKFRVSTFGFIDDSKYCIEMVEAWAVSPMSKHHDCELVFVGENEGGEFGKRLINRISELDLENSIRITGFLDASDYSAELRATDLAVQLRKVTRGETSAAVFDCLAHGIPLIVNRLGAMSELPPYVVNHIPEAVTADCLAEAMTQLWKSSDTRLRFSNAALEYIDKFHSPRAVASDMHASIEDYYSGAGNTSALILKDLIPHTSAVVHDFPDALHDIAHAITQNHWQLSHQPTLFVDISAIVATKKLTGVERTSRSIVDQLLRSPRPGFRIEPVFATKDQRYRTASAFVSAEYNIPRNAIIEAPIEPRAGDVLFVLDWQPEVSKAQRTERARLHAKGVRIVYFVFDLLPIVSPQWFPDFVTAAQLEWMKCIAGSDGAICISKTVAADLQQELAKPKYGISENFAIGWCHLGSDIPNASRPPEHFEAGARPFVLMVGTVEPRKGHRKIVDAFEQVWANGQTTQLVVVGGEGWMVDDLIERLSTLAKIEHRFVWLRHANDDELVWLYENCEGLIMASEGEGFGLPIIEAARYGKPLFVRDIPIFREICGDVATFFADDSETCLAEALIQWLAAIYSGNDEPQAELCILTWQECSNTITSMITDSGHPHWLERQGN